MGKHQDTLEQIRRLNGGLDWKKVEACLRYLGADVYEGSGSTVTFVIHQRKLTVDRPHPRRECRHRPRQARSKLSGSARPPLST